METLTTDLTTSLTAKDVMTRNVISVPSDMPISDLAGFLISHGISGAPVTDESGNLVGVVSITDIARHDGLPTTRGRHLTSSEHHEVYLRVELGSLQDRFDKTELDGFQVEGDPSITVFDLMTPTVFGVVEKMPIQDVADYMIRGKIHRQFVTNGHRVVGVITAMDLLRVVRDLPR